MKQNDYLLSRTSKGPNNNISGIWDEWAVSAIKFSYDLAKQPFLQQACSRSIYSVTTAAAFLERSIYQIVLSLSVEYLTS